MHFIYLSSEIDSCSLFSGGKKALLSQVEGEGKIASLTIIRQHLLYSREHLLYSRESYYITGNTYYISSVYVYSRESPPGYQIIYCWWR